MSPRFMDRRAVRWSIYLVVALLFAVVCWFLSQWQFDRNEERNAQIALVERNYDAPPVPLDEAIGPDGAFDPEDEWLPVRLTGSYVIEDQLLVRNRPHGGTSAFEVIVPFRTDEGRLFLVNRGWVPPGEGAVPDAIPAAPDGEVEVIARLRPSEYRPDRGAPEGQVPTINLPLVSELVGADLITGAYGQLIGEEPAGGQLGTFTPPTEDPGPHLSYAIQWILFAVMGFVFIGYMIRTEIVHRRDEREGRAPKERPRRRDRDADTEDQLLDAADAR